MVFRTLRWKCALLATVGILVMGAASRAAADSMMLEWDPASSDVGYRVHVGTQSGSYSQHFDVGSATIFSFPTATAGQRYCFAVSAYLLSSQLEGPNSTEICGYSNATPTLVNPGNRSSSVGQSVTLQLVGSDPDSQPLTYSATGLPPGLSLMASTGFISGAGTTAGNYSVTVSASDGVLLSAAQTFTWTITAAIDTTQPTATITGPTSGTTWSTATSTMALSGTAADNVGVTQVRWSSDRGGNGVATGTTNWSLSGIPLVAGANVITITAVDAAGNTGTDALTVTYTSPDTTPPTVAISSPTSSGSYTTTSSSMSLGGTAADNVGVTQVRWASDRGTSGIASGTTSWSVSGVSLVSGANVITVTAVDASGNQAAATVTVNYSAPTTPPPPPAGNVTLSVSVRKSRNWRASTLNWSNAPWPSVDVYRNDMLITNTENDGVHTDPIWNRGTYTYKVCAPGSTTTCSNTSTVKF